MLAAVLGAPTYLWVASRWQRFGVVAGYIAIRISAAKMKSPQLS